MKAEITIAFKRHLPRHPTSERTEQASFDTDQSSFIDEAATLIEVLHEYVRNASVRRR
jgi:hypothetical protein